MDSLASPSLPQVDARELRRRWAPLAVLLLVPLLVLWRPLVLGETFYYQDLAGQYFPREALLGRTGLTGWNPHIFLGMGLGGEPQSAAYEPVRALARATGMSDRAGYLLFLGVYLSVAAAGMYAFALRRRASPSGATLAVLGFVWGGLFVVRFRHPWAFGGIAVMPWVALFADRLLDGKRLFDALAVALVIALGTLSGHPQVPYMSWLFVAAWVGLGVALTVEKGQRLRALWALGWRLAVAGLCFAGLLAFYYAPVVALLSKSARSSSGLAFAGSYSFNPWDWVRVLGPDLYGNDMAGTHWGTRNYHEQECYVGVTPLLLVALGALWRAPRERPLLYVALGSFLVAAGRFLPPFYVAYYLVPGFKMFRCPARYNFFFALAAATVAGLVLTRIASGARPAADEGPRVARRLRALWVTLAALAAVAAVAAFAFGAQLDRLVEQPGGHTTSARAALRAAVLLGAGGLVIGAWLRGRLDGLRTSWMLVALTVLDLGAQWLPYRQTRPVADAFPPATVTRALAAAMPARVLVLARQPDGGPAIVPLLNWGEAAGYDDLRGYNQGISPDLLELLNRGDRLHRTLDEPHDLAVVDPEEWLLDLTGVLRIAAPKGQWPAHLATLPLVAEGPLGDEPWEVRQRRAPLPRSWLVGAVEVLPHAAALERLPSLDARTVAVVEEDVGLPSLPSAPPGSALGDVRIVELLADDVTLEADAHRRALLVLADRFDSGWTATVDGAPAAIVRADYLLRGVLVPAGRHTVRFHYTTPARVGGRRVTLLAVPLTLLLLLLSVLRRSKRG